MKLTVYFDGSFWCGLVEYETVDKKYQAYKHTFGKEPKDVEVVQFIQGCLPILIARNEPLSSHVSIDPIGSENMKKRINPKRMQRLINQEKARPSVSTKAQKAISEAHELSAKAMKKLVKKRKEASTARKFSLKQEKRHQKRRGH